jgi:NAD(P)-dependent dehydrogenase (short-subunit alcohol dehydrogenase family)
MGRFDGKNVIVTGAAGGIGAAIVDGFLREGATVVGLGRRQEALDALAAAHPGAALHTGIVDLLDGESIGATATEWIERLGRVHVLVNCAGIALAAKILDITLDQWNETVQTNLTAAFLMSQVLGRHMVDQGGGAIVNISSVDAFIAESPWAAYNASKAGLNQLTRSMAFELGHLGLRCNAVAPGITLTPTMDYSQQEEVWRQHMRMIPMRRFATPGEQASVVLFLASDEASYVNGETVRVDGGELHGFWSLPDLEPPVPDVPERP